MSVLDVSAQDRLNCPPSRLPSRARPDLAVHEPEDASGPWVVELADGRYVRLGRHAAMVLQMADGSEPSVLRQKLGEPWTVELVEATLERLGAAGLLEDAGPSGSQPPSTATDVGSRTGRIHRRRRQDRAARRRQDRAARRRQDRAARRRQDTVARGTSAPVRRVRFAAPASLQVTLVDPGSWMQRHRRLFQRLACRSALVACLVSGGVGLLILAAQASSIGTALSTPLPLPTLLVTFAAFLLVNSLHEIGHAAVLTGYGGRVRRLGFMILYLSPALFCDTTDGWRLPDRRQRVHVALAGVVVNAGCAGLVSVSSVVAAGELRVALILLAVMCYTGAVFNLLPVVKFDGYLALMTGLDLPFLRVKATNDWRSWLARRICGGTGYHRELPQRRWAPAFGLACATAPAALIALVVWNLVSSLTTWGRPGALLRLGLVILLGWLAVRSVLRLLRTAARGGAPRWRRGTAVLVVAATVALLLMIPVANRVEAGYFVSRRGVSVVVSAPDQAQLIADQPLGAEVDLARKGLVTSVGVGAARVGGPEKHGPVPLEAVEPFIRDGVQTTGFTFALRSVHWSTGHASAGAATVRLGTVSAGRWVLQRLVVSPFRTLFH